VNRLWRLVVYTARLVGRYAHTEKCYNPYFAPKTKMAINAFYWKYVWLNV